MNKLKALKTKVANKVDKVRKNRKSSQIVPDVSPYSKVEETKERGGAMVY